MKKVYILDIDGVVVRKDLGVNYPLPHPDITEALRRVQSAGHTISFCTGRSAFSAANLAKAIGLNSFHIADGGAVLWNPMSGDLLFEQTIPAPHVLQAVQTLQAAGICTEVYTKERYLVEEPLWGALGVKHAEILGTLPKRVASLANSIAGLVVTKIFTIVSDPEEKKKVSALHKDKLKFLDLTWSYNPNALPAGYGWLCTPGISKGSAVHKLSEALDIPLANFIGVGDTENDWSFMQICGTSATLANAEKCIKDCVTSRGGLILPDVAENGLLKLFTQI